MVQLAYKLNRNALNLAIWLRLIHTTIISILFFLSYNIYHYRLCYNYNIKGWWWHARSGRSGLGERQCDLGGVLLARQESSQHGLADIHLRLGEEIQTALQETRRGQNTSATGEPQVHGTFQKKIHNTRWKTKFKTGRLLLF